MTGVIIGDIWNRGAHRREGDMKTEETEVAIGAMCHKPRNADLHKKQGQARKILPWGP